ncbi:MAG: hypothetical protein INH41_22140 [Myxococcaceae bacterium]|nr:hypothetical protein [Myxococcaceae bacterium]MCA3015096.1 hypothetical protein [Myxococcaceae bacterium]
MSAVVRTGPVAPGAWVACALLVAGGACREAPRASPPPVPAAPQAPQIPTVITEKDTYTHDGGVSGPGWRLGLSRRWDVVRPEVARLVKPAASAWTVDPDGPEHLTVTCRAKAGPLSEERPGARVEALEGPWLEGRLARFSAADGAHTQARFRLLTQTCDVEVVAPAQRDGARAVEAVSRFEGDKPRLVAALLDLARFLRTSDAAQARLGLYADAGYGDLGGALLMENALARLPVARLTERFQLRVELLASLPPRECGELVRAWRDASPEVLDRLPEASAVRWVELTREAMGLALAASGPPVMPTAAEVEAAVRALVATDVETEEAVKVLQQPQAASSELICEAEKVRLRAMLSRPEAERLALMRSLVGTATLR